MKKKELNLDCDHPKELIYIEKIWDPYTSETEEIERCGLCGQDMFLEILRKGVKQ